MLPSRDDTGEVPGPSVVLDIGSDSAGGLEPLLLRIDEVRRLLGIGRTECYSLIANGIIPSVRLGPRMIRVPRQALLDWLAGQTARTTDERC